MKYPGSDSDYRRWLQTQPSCISGQFSEYLETGEGRSIACHVRRAKDAGTGYKPPYSAVPMTSYEHHYQHQHGELACLKRFRVPEVETAADAKAWLDKQATDHLTRWSLSR